MAKPIVNVSEVLQAQDAASGAAADAGFALIGGRGHGRGAGDIMGIIEVLKSGADWAQYFSQGAFNHHELLVAALELTGAAHLYISSYAMSETAVRTISKLKEAKLVRWLHCVVDDRIETRTAGSAQLLRSIADSYAMAHCHAKVTVLEGEERSVLILGSANYTENRRIEVGMVTTDKVSCCFHQDWIIQTINASWKKQS